ncbi:T9SS type A sorting domain-containing protein [Parabacteroides sp.]
MNIFPTVFSNWIRIRNYQQARSLEIYSADGRMIRKINNPSEQINTGSMPQGIYFFRLITDKTVETIRCIRQ